ncbi:MAG: Lrp/AsnC family transcriptional regulator [Pseudomonadales bacterium]
MKLDRTDRRILEALQQDGSITNLELADKVGLSPSPCSRRVKQMEEAGIIDHSVTLLNPTKLALKTTAYIQISMDKHTPDRFENFEANVNQYPEVVECSLITGHTADYQLKVIVPDMEYYQEFLLGRLLRIEGVSGVHSSFVMKKVIERTALPLEHLRDYATRSGI